MATTKESAAQRGAASFASLEKSGALQGETGIAGSKGNRKYKDSVFVDLFYEDETAQKNLLSLYNALHDTDYQDEKCIHKVRIEDVLYKNFKNDISFEVDGKMLIFGEHQSTINVNMPLRSLMYSGRAYERLVETKSRYRKTLVQFPAPEFYTFYNGTEDYPAEKELSLSEAYLGPAGSNTLELKVKVININTNKSHKVLRKCKVLREYSEFVETVRKYPKESDAMKRAVRECIDRGILENYLKRKGSEVVNMLIAEYSYEEDVAVQKEEAREEGEKIGERRGKKDGIILSGKILQEVKKNPTITNQQISKNIGCTVANVDEVRKALEI